MARWSRLSLKIFTATLLGTITIFYLRDVLALWALADNAPSLTTAQSRLSRQFSNLQTLDYRPGMTILGDSYSVNNSFTWSSYIEHPTTQNLAKQGASVDKQYSLKKDLSETERADVADDLLEQLAKLQFVTETFVIWFGINDLMTIHYWSKSERTGAILAEHETLLSVVDALLQVNVKHILVPLTIDFSASPGCAIARKANVSVSQDITQDATIEWNTHLRNEISLRPQVSTIDFYTISQDWFVNYRDHGLKYLINLDDPTEEAYLWHDFLHMTPFAHRILLAPEFNKALAKAV